MEELENLKSLEEFLKLYELKQKELDYQILNEDIKTINNNQTLAGYCSCWCEKERQKAFWYSNKSPFGS